MTKAKTLNFSASLPGEARDAIETLLEDEPKATRKVYAALAHKVWSLLVERRFDSEIRDWHDLIHGARARIRATDGAAAERLTAIADLLRESISLAETSPAHAVANRPRARSILELLDQARKYLPRRELLANLAPMGSSHLSNVLTQLAAHALVERRDRGKEAEYRITPRGRQLIGADGVRDDAGDKRPLEANDALADRVRLIDPEQFNSAANITKSIAAGPGIVITGDFEVPLTPIRGILEPRTRVSEDEDDALLRSLDQAISFRRSGWHVTSFQRD